MAQSLLENVHAEIRERVAVLRPAAEEYVRLEAALVALGASDAAPELAARPKAPKRRRTPRADGAQPAKRAPRGANQAAVLSVLAERPGVEIAELSAASGVSKPVLYNLLKTLEAKGQVACEKLPSGGTGFRLARQGDPGGTERDEGDVQGSA